MQKKVLCTIIAMVCLHSVMADDGDSLRNEAMKIRNQLTLEEKVRLTYGDFYSGGVPRLGIGELLVMDGPVGIRLSCIQQSRYFPGDEVQTGKEHIDSLPKKTSALPSTLSLAATWDKDAAYDYASIIADEMLAIDAHVLLAPGLNMMRDPRGGRNFEYMGEDPFLTAQMAIQYTRGLQDKRVGVNLKHYVANENDTLRHLTSSRVDEKTLRDVYVYPFERAIREGKAWSVMTANNLLNDTYLGNSSFALKRILREQIGFDGVILTDWRSAYKAKPSAMATLDMTTGFCNYVYGNNLLDLVKSGQVAEGMLDAMVDRILLLYLRAGVIHPEQRGAGAVDTPAFRERIRRITADSMVMLKNRDSLLPLSSQTGAILTGPGATRTISGGGSSAVNRGAKRQTIRDGLEKALGTKLGYLEDPADIQQQDLPIIYCATGNPGREGRDMEDIRLSAGQVAEITRLGEQTDRLVVLVQNSTAVDLGEWNEAADAILLAWMGGQSFGDAVADVLLGSVNPSGRLPCTFGSPIEDYPCAIAESWPAEPVSPNPFTNVGRKPKQRNKTFNKAPQFIMEYKEKDLIGYRGFMANGIAPLYPFGFGLSYTSFELSDLDLLPEGNDYEVRCKVANIGKRKGADVVQLYITSPDSEVKKLRGFTKIEIEPGQSATVSISLRGNDLASYDVASGKWVAPKGEYLVELSDEGAETASLSTTISLARERAYGSP